MPLHPLNKHLGERVRTRRTMKGMSQGALGEALGLTFQQVQKYEKGTNRISSSTLFDISNILETPIGYFFENYDSGENNVSANSLQEEKAEPLLQISNKEILSLVRAFSNIDDAQVRKKSDKFSKISC